MLCWKSTFFSHFLFVLTTGRTLFIIYLKIIGLINPRKKFSCILYNIHPPIITNFWLTEHISWSCCDFMLNKTVYENYPIIPINRYFYFLSVYHWFSFESVFFCEFLLHFKNYHICLNMLRITVLWYGNKSMSPNLCDILLPTVITVI